VAQAVFKRKVWGIPWISEKGNPNFCPFQDRARVIDTLEWDIPDQSWMTRPLPFAGFVEWLGIDRLEGRLQEVRYG